jgi:putative ABC transport system permease protein
MLRNDLTIALRTLWKQKGTTAINVLGLAAGMAVCLLVGLLLWDQSTHDDFHPGADRIYRVTTLMADDNAPMPSSPAPLAPALRTEVSGVETATRMRSFEHTLVRDNESYNASGLYAEPSFFELFGFELEAGNAKQALARPHTAVVTRRLAQRLYGDADPMGQTFRLQDGQPVTVTGVIDRAAYRSHLPFEVLVSFATLRQTRPPALTGWYRSVFSTSIYLRVAENQDLTSISASLEALRRQHLVQPDGVERSRLQRSVRVGRFQLEPLSAVPFSNAGVEVEHGTLPWTVVLLPVGLALLVLLAASFNYVNLSTARSLTRGREVGVRKTMGAHRLQVMGQFMVEAVIVALLALGLSVVLLQGLVPLFNQLSVVHKGGIDISVDPGLRFYGMAVLLAMGIGVLAGLYPAWRLSSFRPAQVLKTGAQTQAPGSHWMTPRKAMIGLQFLMAFVVIVTGTVLYRQFQHMKGGEYPFQVDQVVRVELQESGFEPFQQEARRQTEIQQIGAASGIPVLDRGSWCRAKSLSLTEAVRGQCFSMDYEATQLLDLPVIMEEGFTEARFERGQAVLVTEAGARRFGFSSPQQAIGQLMTLEVRPDEQQQVQIAGIIQNFPTNFEAASENQMIVHYAPERFELALARVVPGRDSTALAQLQSTWEQGATDPFVGTFLRTHVGEQFADALAEFGGVMGLLAVLAVLISCLGLLGIVAYTVQARTREIGIRKALGATVSSVVTLLSRDLLLLVGAAVLVGMPIAWIINREILRNFPYTIDFGRVMLVLIAALLMGVAFVAIAPPTFRAARTDPAKTLRME